MLKDNGVSISIQEGGLPGMLVLSKGDYFEARRLPEIVRKNLLWRFQYKFGVSITRFYNPNMTQ